MGKFFYSQTSVKDLEKEETCPYRWKSQWLDGLIPFTSNEDMDKGSYFEWLFIGAGAITGKEITDLPRLQTGAKSTDQIRIEAQAERAKRLFNPEDPEYLGFKMGRVQLRYNIGNQVGTIDIEAFDQEGTPWVIDVKLTKDLTSDRSKYGWGNDWASLDLLQQIHYESLYEKHEGVKPKMGLLVFDYSPAKRISFGELVISDAKKAEKELRFKAAEEAVNLYTKNGWVKIPNLKECDNCPLVCSERTHKSPISKKLIQY